MLRSLDRVTGRLAALALLLALALPRPAAALPSAESILEEVGFAAADVQKVMGGKFVTTALTPIFNDEAYTGIEHDIRAVVKGMAKTPDRYRLSYLHTNNS